MEINFRIRNRGGQSFLALVFLIGAIVVIVGILIAFLAGSFVDTGYGLSASAQAQNAAQSGIQDAMLQLQRNATVSDPYPDAGYTLPVGSTTAMVYITQNSPSLGEVTVLSVATVSNRTRKVQAVLQQNASTSQWAVLSWQEVQ
jgi:uncharacterized protein (UPF0333 family)